MEGLPLLVHDRGTRTEDSQAVFSVSNQALSPAAIDELRGYRCFETPQGWVLAVDPASLQTFLWRPQDGERIGLPSAEDGFPRRCKCLLSDKPRAATCAVLVLDLDSPEMLVCRIGGSRWDSCTYELTMFVGSDDKPRQIHMANLQGIAAVGGKVYHTFSGGALGVVEFSPELNLAEFRVRMVDLPDSLPFSSYYLVESCGELFMVVVFFLGHNVHKIAEVAVYKMDFSRVKAGSPEWCRVDRIGDRVFLLSGDRSV